MAARELPELVRERCGTTRREQLAAFISGVVTTSSLGGGIGMDAESPDLGRANATEKEADNGKFKTPTLREIEHTGPYMHDGRYKTLEEVVEHYDKGGIKNPNLDRRLKPLKLSKQEKQDLVAFLKALSGEGWQHIKAPRKFPR